MSPNPDGERRRPPPPHRYPASLSEARALQGEVRNVIHLSLVGGPAPPRRRDPPPQTVPILRLICRRALFSCSEHPPVLDAETRRDMYGTVVLSGQRLNYLDQQLLAWICYEVRHRRPSGPMLQIVPSRVAQHLYASRRTESKFWPSGKNMDRVRGSLERLCSARLAIFDQGGESVAGSETSLVSFLSADAVADGENQYRLSGWFRAQLYRALERPEDGAIELTIPWAPWSSMHGLTSLLYGYLECHHWRSARPVPHPLESAGDPIFRTRYWELLPPFLDTFSLSGQRKRVRSEIRRAMAEICARDSRYEAFDLPPGQDRLYVWRRDQPPSPGLFWAGRLCRRCRRPDPDSVCCCASPPAERCHKENCYRCAEHDPSAGERPARAAEVRGEHRQDHRRPA